MDHVVLQGCQRVRVALARHDGAQDLLTRLSHHVGDDVGELDVHLRERLLHVMHAARLGAQRGSALTGQRTQHAHRVARAEGTVQQPKAVQLL